MLERTLLYFNCLFLDISSLCVLMYLFPPPNHVDKISSFDSNYKFYLVKKEQRISFILAVKVIDKQSIDKIMFSLNGVVLNRITDVFCDGYIERTSGNKRMIIKNDNIL
jgi:hypothetical protein